MQQKILILIIRKDIKDEECRKNNMGIAIYCNIRINVCFNICMA